MSGQGEKEFRHSSTVPEGVTVRESALVPHDREAIAAVNRTIGLGLKRNASFLAAASASRSKILPGASGGILARIPAGLATLGLILEASLSVELLLTGGEHELVATLFAYQRLVLIHC
jgi:hypothetical protein